MGLEVVKEEIISSAKEQANSLLAEARKEANKIMKEAEKEVEVIKEKSEAETKKVIEIIKLQEISSAELENKKKILEAKKQVIEGVFSEAKNRVEKLDEKRREYYIKKLIEKVKSELEAAHMYCNKKDIKFLKGFEAEHINIAGGLIAENKEKSIRVDYSFDTMLENIKDMELQNINKILFS